MEKAQLLFKDLTQNMFVSNGSSVPFSGFWSKRHVYLEEIKISYIDCLKLSHLHCLEISDFINDFF